MSVAEMKKVILGKVEILTEQQLIELNRVIDAINNTPTDEYNLLPYVENIVAEREEVLKKLAQ